MPWPQAMQTRRWAELNPGFIPDQDVQPLNVRSGVLTVAAGVQHHPAKQHDPGNAHAHALGDARFGALFQDDETRIKPSLNEGPHLISWQPERGTFQSTVTWEDFDYLLAHGM